MIKLYKYEAIDEDTCYEKCIEDLDVYASDILVEAEELEDSYKMNVINRIYKRIYKIYWKRNECRYSIRSKRR